MPSFVYYLYLIPLFLSALLGLRSFKDKWAKPYRFFSIFLAVTLFNEIFAISWKLGLNQTRYWSYPKSNIWIYNIYLVPQYLFYLLFYGMLLDYSFFKRLMYPLLFFFALFGLVNLLFIQSLRKLNTFTIIGGNLLIILCTVLYFIQELNRKEPLRVEQHPLFWISLGGLVFNTISLPYFVSINYLSKVNPTMAIALFYILLGLNIIMYSFYLFAFLCKDPSRRKLS